jgi:hypothetical protein
MANKKESWKPITIDGKKPTVPYMISNHGRFGVLQDGEIQVRTFKPTAGNYRYNTRQNGKNKAIFLYKEVAKAFLPKPSPRHKFIIHKDHNYLNDHVDNLKWATHEEHRAHTAMSPRSVLSREKKAIIKSSHAKVLDEKAVIRLKPMIWDPKRKLSYKKLAEKFGVSEMQIYRIKTGEFWYHVRVDNEPLHPKHKQNLSNISFQKKRKEREASARKKTESARLAELRKLEQQRKKALAAEEKNRRAVAAIRMKKIREKALRRARFLRLQAMARDKQNRESQRLREQQIKKSKPAPRKKTNASARNYSIIKLSAKRTR